MADGTTSFSVSPESGDPFDQLMAQVRQAAEGAYDVLGEMGRSKSGNVVYLARELETGHLVAMKLSRAGGNEFNLEVVRTLDGAVPGLENKCPECKSVLPDWDRFCFRCGADLSAGGGPAPGADESAQLLDAVKEATAGEYDIIGKMDREGGGGPVFFARDLKRGKLVALRLRKDESADPGQAAYSIGETQVFRPLAAELGATQVAPAGFGYSERPSPAAPPSPPRTEQPVSAPFAAVPAPTPAPVGAGTRRPPWKLIAGAAAAVLVVLVGYLAFRDPEVPAPAPPPPVPPAVEPPPPPAVAEPPTAAAPPAPPPPSTAAREIDSGTVVLGIPLPAGARLTVDGRTVRGARIRVAPGGRTLAIMMAGSTGVAERVTVRPGATFVWRPTLAVTPPPAAAPAPPPPPPPPAAPSATCARASARGDWTQALELCRKEAAAGDATAQRLLARIHENGTGVAKNPAEAFQWFTRAAAGGDREAQERLGYLYRDGVGTGKDEARSAMFFRQAADGGRPVAQLELGVALEDGKGVRENDAEAAQWYEKSSAQGIAQAARRLGRLYERGQGVAKSEAEAAKWYRTAGERGDRDAQFFLGRFYKEGKGVEKSDSLALEWFRKAAAQGHRDAQSEVRKLEKP